MEENWREPFHSGGDYPARATFRNEQQLHSMRGTSSARWTTLFIVLVIMIISFYQAGLKGLLLLYLGVIPAAIILLLLRYQKEYSISLDLMLEMFWAGGIVSVSAAIFFEIVGQLQTAQAWACQKNEPSIFCDLRFIVVVIVTIGFVEELAKLLPLGIVRIADRHVPYTCTCFFRLIDSPYGLALAGAASASGFAAMENVKYIFGADSFNQALQTSAFRAILAIPFHIACTTYAACRLASKHFDPRNPDILPPHPDILPPPSQTNGTSPPFQLPRALLAAENALRSQAHLPRSTGEGDDTESEGTPADNPRLAVEMVGTSAAVAGSDSPAMPIADFRRNSYSSPSLVDYFLILSVPSILHGVYDSGLFLSRQMFTPEDSTQFAVFYFLGLGCIATSLTSYLTMIILAVVEWLKLRNLFNPLQSFSSASPWDLRRRDDRDHHQSSWVPPRLGVFSGVYPSDVGLLTLPSPLMERLTTDDVTTQPISQRN